jgi:hypothetical protein
VLIVSLQPLLAQRSQVINLFSANSLSYPTRPTAGRGFFGFGFFFGGRPPFLPFSRAASALAFDFALPPSLPSAAAAAFTSSLLIAALTERRVGLVFGPQAARLAAIVAGAHLGRLKRGRAEPRIPVTARHKNRVAIRARRIDLHNPSDVAALRNFDFATNRDVFHSQTITKAVRFRNMIRQVSALTRQLFVR